MCQFLLASLADRIMWTKSDPDNIAVIISPHNINRILFVKGTASACFQGVATLSFDLLCRCDASLNSRLPNIQRRSVKTQKDVDLNRDCVFCEVRTRFLNIYCM